LSPPSKVIALISVVFILVKFEEEFFKLKYDYDNSATGHSNYWATSNLWDQSISNFEQVIERKLKNVCSVATISDD
jgi:hypothetical protein